VKRVDRRYERGEDDGLRRRDLDKGGWRGMLTRKDGAGSLIRI